MNAEQLLLFREILNARLQALLQSSGATLEALSATQAELTGSHDLRTTTGNFRIKLESRERALVRKIQEAIGRIEDGSFGYCEACGAEIGHRRLMSRPMATHCIDCKTEVEAYESGHSALR